MLLDRPEELDEAKLRKLCDDKCPESQTLDFKRTLPDTSPEAKAEFLKDVCAFANVDGGDLVYGISDDGGVAGAVFAISDAMDHTKRRLRQVLDGGIEPRVPGLQMQEVAVAGGHVLVIRVAESFDGPHRIAVNQGGRFVMRNGTGTSDFSYQQLRTAFDRTATLTEKARGFIAERLKVICGRGTWKLMRPDSLAVVHVVPLAGLSGRQAIDVKPLYSDYSDFHFADWPGATRSFNFEGLAVYPTAPDEGNEYVGMTQVFRSGAIESLRSQRMSLGNSGIGVHAAYCSRYYRLCFEQLVRGAKRAGVNGPAIVSFALVNVGATTLLCPPTNRSSQVQRQSDRQHIVLPEAWVDSVESLTSIDEVIRPLLDVLWQTFGAERCWLYDESGGWDTLV